MPTSVLKSQKTSNSLGKLYINNWKENRRKIRTNTLYLTYYNFQKLDHCSIRLRKQSQYNKPNFCFLIRCQDIKNQY